MIALVIRLVEFSRRYAAAVIITVLLAVAVVGVLAARHLGIDTDTGKLFSSKLPWRQAVAAMARAFPQNNDLIAVVIDAATPDQAEDAAATLTTRMAADQALFQDVRQPEGGEFLRRNGLLFLPRADVQRITDEMIAAQPMLGTLAADPSTRGVFNALDLLAQGPLHGDIAADVLARPFRAAAEAIDAAAAGRYLPLSWQNLLSDRPPLPEQKRRIVLARPVLNYGAVEPGQRAIAAVHAMAQAEGFTAARGVLVRVTGPVALSDDQLAALKEGAGFAAWLRAHGFDLTK